MDFVHVHKTMGDSTPGGEIRRGPGGGEGHAGMYVSYHSNRISF